MEPKLITQGMACVAVIKLSENQAQPVAVPNPTTKESECAAPVK